MSAREPDRLDRLRKDLRDFVDERDWDQFHSLKDLAVGLTVEAGELLEVFQWWDPDVDAMRSHAGKRERLMDETADVLLYALLIADKADFDLVEAAHRKLAQNRRKYPADRARGRAAKYDEL